MRTRRPPVRALAGLALAGAVVLTSGCSGGGAAPTASAAPETVAELCAEPLVIDCTEGEGALTVVLAAAASDDDVRLYAQHGAEVGAAAALDGGVTVQVEGIEAPQLDVEISAPPKLTIQVYPGDDVARTLEQVIEVSDVPGTTGISVDGDGWPTVEVLNLSEFEWVFTSVKELPLFEDGGTYTLVSSEPRLRIVYVPSRMSEEAIREIIAIALAYPDAEVLLEAATTSPHNPTLYISGLTPDEVTVLDARLSDPKLADADVDGYAVSFVLGTTADDGVTTYTSGTLGGVPAE